MDKKDQDYLISQLKITDDFQNEFFLFHQNSKLQFHSNQLQYFQSIGSITLTLVAFLLATKSVVFSVPWFLTALTSLVLVIYIATYVREANDLQANALEHESKALDKTSQETLSAAMSAIKADDVSVFTSYVTNKHKKETQKPSTSYAGEIAVLLFLLTVFYGVLAFINQYFAISTCVLIIAIILVTFLAFFTSMLDWNMKVTQKFSNTLSSLFKK